MQKECESAQVLSENLRTQVKKAQTDLQAKVSEYEALQNRYNNMIKERAGDLDATQTELLDLQSKVAQHEHEKTLLKQAVDQLQA